MLQHLRDNSKGVISGILIGLLVIIFAVSGAEALFKWDANASKAITVNGDTITESDIVRGVANRKQQILSRYGESVPADFLTDEKLRPPVIDSLIQRALLTQAAQKGGFTANTALINGEIISTQAFQKDGKFDQERYIQLLRYQGFTPATYHKAISEDMIINQVQSAVASTEFVTPTEMKNIIGLSFQSRDFSYLLLPVAAAEKAAVVEDKDIQDYYKANPQIYTTPEQVAVDYIELSTAELAKAVAVSDEQVQKQFEQNSSAFVPKTERQAAHILLDGADAEKRAQEIKAKLDAGEDFAKLAKEYSTDAGSKDQGGDLGFTSGDVFPAPFEAALAKLKVGEVSAPVKSDAGVHIIKLLSERASKAPTLEEAKPAIVEQLKRAEAEAQFAAKQEKLRDLSYNADKLADVATELGLSVQNTGLFAKTGGKDLTANNAFVTAAFSPEVLEQGNASDIIEIDPNRVVVLKRTDRKPAQLQPLDVVKDKVRAVVLAQKTEALLAKQAKDVITALAAGKSLDEQAKTLDLEVKTVANATRADKDADRDVLQYAFTMAAPTATKLSAGNVRTAKGDMAVVSLAAVHLGAEDKVTAEQRTAISTQLATINGETDFRSYQAHLQEVAKIKRK